MKKGGEFPISQRHIHTDTGDYATGKTAGAGGGSWTRRAAGIVKAG